LKLTGTCVEESARLLLNELQVCLHIYRAFDTTHRAVPRYDHVWPEFIADEIEGFDLRQLHAQKKVT
jgi:hypothetical protein